MLLNIRHDEINGGSSLSVESSHKTNDTQQMTIKLSYRVFMRVPMPVFMRVPLTAFCPTIVCMVIVTLLYVVQRGSVSNFM